MKEGTIRTLRHDDADALLQFELDNRAWFEQHIVPRPADFYTPEGVRVHIALYLSGYEQGTWHPCVIVDEKGRIVGRANLKDLDRLAGTAEVGYRIAHNQTGKGWATKAVRHMTALASSQWRLSQVVAYVIKENVASAKVLEKCGYILADGEPMVEDIGGVRRACHQFIYPMPTIA